MFLWEPTKRASASISLLAELHSREYYTIGDFHNFGLSDFHCTALTVLVSSIDRFILQYLYGVALS